MAVRVRLRLRGSGGEIVSSAVLNGGFEYPEPHLLLPARCAQLLLGDYRSRASREEVEAAGGDVTLLLAAESVFARVVTKDREGPDVSFLALISDADEEILVSDAGIDALGIRIESFAPGRWRLVDETHIRDTEPPQAW